MENNVQLLLSKLVTVGLKEAENLRRGDSFTFRETSREIIESFLKEYREKILQEDSEQE